MAELFANFEVNRDQPWRTLLQLCGASLAFHLVVLGGLIYVPAVRDALNIAALIGNTGFVDKPYEKTAVEDVQMLSLANNKFHYPPGYFLTDAELLALAQPQSNTFPAPIAFPRYKERIISTPTPTPTPEPSPSPSPNPSPERVLQAQADTAKQTSDADAKSPEDPEEIEKKLQDIARENSVARPNEDEINTRPLKEWLARANELKLKGGLDLTKELEITIAATLNSACRLTDAKVLQKSGDERLTDVAKEMVSAIGDSGMLSFLRDPKKVKDPATLGCDEIPLQLTIKLDQNQISATVESQADSPERAAQMAKGYNGLLSVGQLVKQGHDEEAIYKNTRVTAEGKQIIVSFSMPRQTAGEMLQKQLPPSG
jgi:hypothetical protein